MKSILRGVSFTGAWESPVTRLSPFRPRGFRMLQRRVSGVSRKLMACFLPFHP
jgi:hypothetical protein